MKDLHFFIFRSLVGAKIKRSFGSTCNGDKSTSTLDQVVVPSTSSSCIVTDSNNNAGANAVQRKGVTLEEMISQLESDEEKARKDEGHRRMSCVNNSDILRSSRNALNQYPRYSLDSRDAMLYRSSLHKDNVGGRAIDGLKLGRMLHLPQSLGGESVIWFKPGVVPKLMGLEAMSLPISRLYNSGHCKHKHSKEKLCSTTVRSQNLRRKIKRTEMEGKRRRHVMDSKVSCQNIKKLERSGGDTGGSCSRGIKSGL